jgi:hypothetical protein
MCLYKSQYPTIPFLLGQPQLLFLEALHEVATTIMNNNDTTKQKFINFIVFKVVNLVEFEGKSWIKKTYLGIF